MAQRTEAAGATLKEANMINKSLTTLGAVMRTLEAVSNKKTTHIRYRDSKLTFLLKDSLGGNSQTSIIATVSPSADCFDETVSTLKVRRACV